MSMIRNFALIVLSVMTFQSASHAETPAGKQAGHIPELVSSSVDTKTTAVVTTVDTKKPEVKSLLYPDNDTRALYSTLPNKSIKKKVDDTELQCLAKNIYYESGNQPEEGKVAVGLVTLNRKSDSRFPSTVCGVVNQRSKRAVCQFSWRCQRVRALDKNGAQWTESHRIAMALLSVPAMYQNLKKKYFDALYFHATYVRPSWSYEKFRVARVAGHIFYRD